jgi:hypothetical protein
MGAGGIWVAMVGTLMELVNRMAEHRVECGNLCHHTELHARST